ncbi:SRPBCC family protein [Baekduia soli]|uniref:SRPBCC family protein n=2 Tax=Baekduia soli TaxID=496014 RepID=A0A5B8UDD1_9ACTN|nr:SRPBCC family protein [Baekduia soli]
MAQTERLIPASPDRLFAVLSDPASYAHWVVGSDTIRAADRGWPAVGAKIHHRVGWGPLKLDDTTEVLAADAPRHLRLKARARPLGTAHVDLRLEAQGGSTLVTMTEDAGDPLTRLAFNPLTHHLVHRRNVESLRRLEELALGRGPATPDPPRSDGD